MCATQIDTSFTILELLFSNDKIWRFRKSVIVSWGIPPSRRIPIIIEAVRRQTLASKVGPCTQKG